LVRFPVDRVAESVQRGRAFAYTNSGGTTPTIIDRTLTCAGWSGVYLAVEGEVIGEAP
jgi:hypothetical protein